MRPPSLADKSYGKPGTSEGAELLEQIASLVVEARTATDLRRGGMVGAVNALMARLPSEVAPGEGAALLQRLLGEGALDGLEDEEGLPTSIVATRTLLDLGYPHALEVAPERLEALRRWTNRLQPVPWVGLAVTLFFAFVVQLAFVTFGMPDRHFMRMSLAALAGEVPAPEPTWWEQLGTFMYGLAAEVFVGQLLAHFVAYVMAVTVGWSLRGYWLTRRVFLGLGVLWLLVGGLQWAAGGWLTMSTWSAAAGALAAGWLMKKQ
jgi:hypothetical protein